MLLVCQRSNEVVTLRSTDVDTSSPRLQEAMPGTRFRMTIYPSGGEVTFGVASIWGSVENWGELDTEIPSEEIRSDDQAPVSNLGGVETSYGTAVYNAGWKLLDSTFQDPADMYAFAEDKNGFATARVGSLGVYYEWSGSAWERKPFDVSYTWPEVNNWAALNEIQDPQEDDTVAIRGLVISPPGFTFRSYSGEAIYTSGTWKLTKANADTEQTLIDYITDEIYEYSAVNGCIGIVSGIAVNSAQSVYYYWNEASSTWLRTPNGTGYIHPTVENWDALPSSNLYDGDQVAVTSIGAGTDTGIAKWSSADSSWKLLRADFESPSSLSAFIEEIWPGAIASSDDGSASQPWYIYQADPSSWLRLPDGVNYIWPQVPLWENLDSLDGIKNNDRVQIEELNTLHSNGTAELHGGTWKLIEGYWTSVADMNLWADGDIHPGAMALVDPGHHYDEDSTVYYRVGSSWIRMAKDVPVTFVISSLQDFSGVGLKEGDYGIHTPSGGSPILVRYKAACPITATIGGTAQMWLPPVVYAGTPEIKAYIVGTEANDTVIGNKGWSVARVDTGTVGTVDEYMRLRGPITAALTGSSGTLTGPSFTGANKFYLVGEFRGAASGADPYAGIFGNATASIPVQYALGTGNSSTLIRQKFMPASAWANADGVGQLMNGNLGGLAWPATTPYLVQALSGAVMTDLVETRFGGKLYTSFRRNFDSAVDASSYSLLLIANGGGSSTTSTLEFKNLYFVTY